MDIRCRGPRNCARVGNNCDRRSTRDGHDAMETTGNDSQHTWFAAANATPATGGSQKTTTPTRITHYNNGERTSQATTSTKFIVRKQNARKLKTQIGTLRDKGEREKVPGSKLLPGSSFLCPTCPPAVTRAVTSVSPDFQDVMRMIIVTTVAPVHVGAKLHIWTFVAP